MLTVDGLGVRTVAGPVVSGIRFRLRPGTATCIVGETGAGKSLVAQALFGLLAPGLVAEGTLTLADGRRFDLADPARLQALWGSALFLLPQEPRDALDPTARLLGQVAEVPVGGNNGGAGGGGGARARRLLAQFGLAAAAQSVPAALSGGMAQRGLLAIAAAVAAPVLVADEPTKGLDPARMAEVTAALHGMTTAGRALLVVTHDLSLPAALQADLLVLHDGAVVEQGPAASVLGAPRHVWTRTLVAAHPECWSLPRPARAGGAAALSARDLAFAWPGRPPLFRGVSFDVPAGTVLGVAGASGTGKSTLCDVLLGLRRPSAGHVDWAGRDPMRMARRERAMARRRLQKLYQDPAASFPPHRRLRAVFADLAAVTDDPLGRLAPLMERLRVRAATLDRRVGDISGGEAQRLALARALLLRPTVLVADEPTSRLDTVTQAEIARLLRTLVEQDGLTVLWVSHDAPLLAAVAERTVVLPMC